MDKIDIITEGSVFEPQVYEFQGVNCVVTAIPFFVPGDGEGRERLYQKYGCDEGTCHTVLSWVAGHAGLPYPNLEIFPDEEALFGAYPILRRPTAGARWSIRPCCAAHDIFQSWRDGTRPNVDLMPVELREKCCIVIRRYGWMKKSHYNDLNLPIGLIEFRPGASGAAATLYVANTFADLVFARPELQSALDCGLRESFALRLEQKKTFHAEFDEHCLRDPRVSALLLKGAGQYLLVRRRFPTLAGESRCAFTLLTWTGNGEGSRSLCADYATLDALVREHPDLEVPLVKYHQDVVPAAGGGAE